jgi:hypothetical protein
MLALLRTVPFADVSLEAEELNTLIGLFASPFLVIASLTTFVVGWSACVAAFRSWETPYMRERVEDAIAFGTVRAFVVSIPPAVLLVISVIEVYT